MVVYKKLQFPLPTNRAYFFSNFVTTIDGKSVIKNTEAYIPIGSTNDYDTFIDLRTYADALIHGKHTAAAHRTIDTIAQRPFLKKRSQKKKTKLLPYFIVSNHPDETLLPALVNNSMEKPTLVTHEKSNIPISITNLATIVRLGENTVDLVHFAEYLFQQGIHHVLVEGGPTLMGSFLSNNLIDEVFLTIAPKILNGRANEFLTMTEGKLLDPKTVQQWKLISMKTIHNELFLRYKLDPETSSG